MHDEIIDRLKRNGGYIDWDGKMFLRIGSPAIEINTPDIEFMNNNFDNENKLYTFIGILTIILGIINLLLDFNPFIFVCDVISTLIYILMTLKILRN